MKAIQKLYYGFIFLLPLVFFRQTSEIFEFNKIIFTYFFVSIIIFLIGIYFIKHNKIIFRRTIYYQFIILFLISQTISFLFSIDKEVSFFGSAGRFNGGLLSFLAYFIIVTIYLGVFKKKPTLKLISAIIYSSLIVSIYAILQRLGIDKNWWNESVSIRVFSTFGQPNWLGIYNSIIIILSLINFKKYKYFIGLNLISLLLTKSRSSIFALLVGLLIIVFFTQSKKIKIVFLSITFLALTFFGINYLNKNMMPKNAGTESGLIRKYIWTAGINGFLKRPFIGYGPETFSYIFYLHKPVEHNLTSEWNYLYNKAHNEFINYLATTGIFGLGTYLALLGAIVYILYKNYIHTNKRIHIIFMAEVFTISVSSFLGFSVVYTNLILFLLPALSITVASKDNPLQRIILYKQIGILLCIASLFFIYSTFIYWYQDVFRPVDQVNSIEMADRKIINKPYDVNAYKYKANVLLNLAIDDPNYLKALPDVYKQALLYSPVDPKLYYNLGITYARLGDTETAKIYLKKAYFIKPNYLEAKQALDMLK